MIDKKFIKLRWHFPTLLIEMSALPSILYFLSVLLKDEQMAEKSARYKTSHHQSYESKIKTMNQKSNLWINNQDYESKLSKSQNDESKINYQQWKPLAMKISHH